MNPTRRSLRALDVVNVFMADVKDGVGVYLSVYLLTEHRWEPAQIGLVGSLPWFVSIAAQSPVGGWIDRTRWKRGMLAMASAVIAVSCLVVAWLPRFWPIAASQVAVGLMQTIFPPCVAAITLGMVGRRRLAARVGRNESFNHAGNMLAAAVSVGIAGYVSYVGIFYFSVLQCVAIVVAVMLIDERDIDHTAARAAHVEGQALGSFRASLRQLLGDRDVAWFTLSMMLWNLANGAMLPLLGQKLGKQLPAQGVVSLSLCIIIAQTVMIGVAPLAGRWATRGRKGIFSIAFVLVPVRAALFAVLDDRYALMALQGVDGIGAGIYGVLSILMMADLARGTGRFNLLQGVTYAACGLGVACSNLLGGFAVDAYGYSAAFVLLGALGALATLVFATKVAEPPRQGASHEALATQLAGP